MVLTTTHLDKQGPLGRSCDTAFHPFKRMARTIKVMMRSIHQSQRAAQKCMHGIKIPMGHKMAMRFDAENGNTEWRDSEKVEIDAIARQKVFRDMGKGAPVPPGHKLIRLHVVCTVKHDSRFKSRLVADGNSTELPSESVCSSVVSLRSARIVTFAAELNDLEVWVTDIGNAHIESHAKEKVCVCAGEEFGDLAGHSLLIDRALCGLWTSGKMWAQRSAEALHQMGFFPCLADNDVWIRNAGDHCEHIAACVDDPLIASRNPQAILDTFADTCNFLLKGSGPITFHLGCDHFRDDEGVLCQSPRKRIQRITESFALRETTKALFIAIGEERSSGT